MIVDQKVSIRDMETLLSKVNLGRVKQIKLDVMI